MLADHGIDHAHGSLRGILALQFLFLRAFSHATIVATVDELLFLILVVIFIAAMSINGKLKDISETLKRLEEFTKLYDKANKLRDRANWEENKHHY